MATERPAEAPAPRRRPLRVAAGVIGDLLFTTGLPLALLVLHSLWWTDLTAARHADAAADDLRRHWSSAAQTARAAPLAGTAGTPAPPPYAADGGIGFLHVPAMGSGYRTTAPDLQVRHRCHRPGAHRPPCTGPGRYITLTTCTPVYTSL
ncbi:hypothetical protein [Kitasatospora sp. RG8]|uniref:hypothetical protein n=1 Tax=Kitasatospora sp. RG8 TaxID=2820815 RepID=UPI001FD78028|nr:hypothetical protein [Kitasatospora sp. RG8]